MAEMDDLDSLIANLPNSGTISSSMKLDALSRALIPDSNGVWPGQPGYAYTYDVYFAAMSLVGFLQAQPVVRQSSSEGTSVAVDAPNWSSLLDYYRSMSPIIAAQGSTLLQVLNIPDGAHVRRTDMRGRYGDADVDTDYA